MAILIVLVGVITITRMSTDIFPNINIPVVKREYEAEFPLRWVQKDLHLASISAYESGVATPLTNAAKELYRPVMRQGHATEDFSAVYEYLASGSNSASRFALSAADFPFGTEQN